MFLMFFDLVRAKKNKGGLENFTRLLLCYASKLSKPKNTELFYLNNWQLYHINPYSISRMNDFVIIV